MNNEDDVKLVLKIIARIFSNTEVSPQQTFEDLEEIKEDINIRQDTLK